MNILNKKIYLTLLLSSCFMLSTCGGNPAHSKPEQPQPSVRMKNLETYFPGENPKLNEISAVNVTELKPSFDFAYTPDQDESLTLTNVKSGTLLGCDDSDIGFTFTLHRFNPNGEIDLSSYQGIGYSPTSVYRGEHYVVRVTFNLDKTCLGIAYTFGIKATR